MLACFTRVAYRGYFKAPRACKVALHADCALIANTVKVCVCESPLWAFALSARSANIPCNATAWDINMFSASLKSPAATLVCWV